MSAVIVWVVLVVLGPAWLASPVSAADGAEPPRDFAALWAEAQRWAREANAVANECVFRFRFDPKTRHVKRGHAAMCDEPYRSPFYPWPEPSRPGARFTAREVERAGLEMGLGAASPGAPRPDDPLDACGLVVGFTSGGEGAEAVECYLPRGNVPGQPANAQFVVAASGDRRVVSGLYERISHLTDRAVRKTLAPSPTDDAEETVRVEGTVIGREAGRLLVRGRAVPVSGSGGTQSDGTTANASIVVEFPSDDALRPGYYYGGKHCPQGRRNTVAAGGASEPQWLYGPCPLGPDRYWVFEEHPPGKRTLWHGPYREYAACDAERQKLRSTRLGTAGHCVAKPKVALRMRQDGTLVVPRGAPRLD